MAGHSTGRNLRYRKSDRITQAWAWRTTLTAPAGYSVSGAGGTIAERLARVDTARPPDFGRRLAAGQKAGAFLTVRTGA